MATPRKPITNESLQHWIKFPDSANYIRVTEDTSADSDADTNEYSPEYIDRRTQPKFVLGKTITLSYELDAWDGEGIQKNLAALEDKADTAVEYVRTLDYDFANSKVAPQDKLIAKHATGLLNVEPIAADGVGALKMKFSVAISSEFDQGTFNGSTGTYTAGTTTPAGPRG